MAWCVLLRRSAPITVALVDDYDVVLVGVAHMFDRHSDRVVIAVIDANKPLVDQVDIVLYDSFAQPESDYAEINVLIESSSARRVVVYTWNFHPDLISSARRRWCPRVPVEGASRPGVGRGTGSRPCRRTRGERPTAPGTEHHRSELARTG